MRRFGVFFLACFTGLLLSQELALSLPVAGVGPDLMIVVVVAFTSREQPRTAAMMGFFAGLLRDLVLPTPAGLTAFAYAVTAYAVALVGAVRGVWAFVGLVAGATFVSQALYGLGTILVATRVDVSPLPRVMLVTTLYDALLAPLLAPLLRRIASVEGVRTGTSGESR